MIDTALIIYKGITLYTTISISKKYMISPNICTQKGIQGKLISSNNYSCHPCWPVSTITRWCWTPTQTNIHRRGLAQFLHHLACLSCWTQLNRKIYDRMSWLGLLILDKNHFELTHLFFYQHCFSLLTFRYYCQYIYERTSWHQDDSLAVGNLQRLLINSLNRANR